VIGAPLFILSVPRLVIAQCTAGVVGSVPALNARPAAQLDDWLAEITEALAAHDRAHPERRAAPFALNQIVHKSNDRLDSDLAAAVKWRVPITISSLGARADVNAAAHSYGGVVLHDVTNNTHARKAIEKGADGLVAVCAGAGGHAGAKSPFALLQEIRAWFGGPLALAGAIATGRAVLAAQAAGADFAYVGSAFIATHEARAAPAYKQAVVDGASDDVVGSSFFTGVFGNYLRPSIVAAGLDPDRLPEGDARKMDFGSAGAAGAARAVDAADAAGGAGDKAKAKAWKDVRRSASARARARAAVRHRPHRSCAPLARARSPSLPAQIWGCGQGIAPVDAVVGAGELVARLHREYEAAKEELARGVERTA
jgi:nitronate monooxygenase